MGRRMSLRVGWLARAPLPEGERAAGGVASDHLRLVVQRVQLQVLLPMRRAEVLVMLVREPPAEEEARSGGDDEGKKEHGRHTGVIGCGGENSEKKTRASSESAEDHSAAFHTLNS